jgi:transposase
VRDPEELSREELIAVVRDQAAQLSGQATRLAEQAAELERLRSELEQIKRLISRNSGNSSMPPSSDDAPGKGRPSGPVGGKRSRTDRKRGKQPGAAGAHLPWPAEGDVEVVDRLPQGACECGADLAGAVDLGVERGLPGHGRAVGDGVHDGVPDAPGGLPLWSHPCGAASG